VAEGPGQTWPVPAALEGERLDRALALITGLSRSQVNDIVDAGRVTIGRRPVTSRSRRVHEGEKLTVSGSIDLEVDPGPQADLGVEVPVVYADDEVVVVDKPAGLVVHPGHGQRHGTLVHGLLARYPELARFGGERPGIVHRLDKGTSGLMVVARTEAAAEDLIGQLSRRQVRREYRALLIGDLASDEGVIDAPLGRSDLDPSRIRVQAGGRPARTGYRVLERYGEPKPTTLVACRLESGRTHQIRVHFSSIGHPVVGDDRYAAELEFTHPGNRQAMAFESPLPKDLSGLLDALAARSRG
jgi:23S rRNA pseudouridine1911/1915/1917 synthase